MGTGRDLRVGWSSLGMKWDERYSVSPGRSGDNSTKNLLLNLIALLALLAVLAIWTVELWNLPVEGADSTLDWLVAKAAGEGRSPYVDLAELGSVYGIDGLSHGVAPRLPGALLLLSGLGLFTPVGAFRAMLFLNGLAFVALVAWSLPRLSLVKRRHILAVAPLLLVSEPFFSNSRLGQWSLVVALLVSMSWLTARRYPTIAGVAGGLAAVLKLWPLVILVPFALERRLRPVGVAAVTFLGLNVAGMLFYGISFKDVIYDINAARLWTDLSRNGSVFGFFDLSLVTVGLIASVVGLALLSTSRWAATSTMPAAIAAGVLVTPVSWEHYDVVLFCVAAWCVAEGGYSRTIAVAWIIWQVIVQFTNLLLVGPQVGLVLLVGRIVLLSAVVMAAVTTGRNRGSLELPGSQSETPDIGM